MEEERLKNFGLHIRELRESQGMSQEELAKKSGFAGRAAISAIEKGKNSISVDRIPDLAEALNTTPSELTEVLFNEPSSFNISSLSANFLTVQQQLNEALQIRKMTAAELSRKSGIDKGSISNYLKGKFIPKQNAIYLMAKALNVSPAWLLGYELTIDGKAKQSEIDISKLTEENRIRLTSYYQALLDSQED